MAFEIESSAFKAHEVIPVKYTCSGDDVSPSLIWREAPGGTVSLAIICDDSDAPGGSWVHWIIYNIPSDLAGLSEAVAQEERIGERICQGVNGFCKIGYNGPCPPPGRPHRYVFTIYALDTFLHLKGEVDKQDLLQAMDGHILEDASLTGEYGR